MDVLPLLNAEWIWYSEMTIIHQTYSIKYEEYKYGADNLNNNNKPSRKSPWIIGKNHSPMCVLSFF